MKTLSNRIVKLFVQVRQADEGQGYTEYALIMALIAVAVIAALTSLGGNISTALNNLAGQV